MPEPIPSASAPLPAFIICDESSAGLKIAALTVLDRLVVALHRAGAGPITIVASGELPALKRARALGISFERAAEIPVWEHPALVARANVLAGAADIRRCVEKGGQLATSDGVPLGIGVARRLSNGPVEELLAESPAVAAQGVARVVSDHASAKAAERALWDSLGSTSDGFVDKVFNRPCGRPLSKLLIHTPVSPNAVSLASILIGVASAVFFAMGHHQAVILGAVLFQLSAIVDCVDGDLARILFKESALGKWLDLAGDQVVHVSVFAAIAWGVASTGQTPGMLWLGVSAVAGALISFAVVVRGMRGRPGENGALRRLIDAATNRDFSVLVFVLACFQQLEWFLWMSAIGSHVFWMTALGLQMRPPRARRFA